MPSRGEYFMRLILILLFSFSNHLYAFSLEDSVKTLSSKEMGGRRAGTPGNVLAQNYLINQLKKFKIAPFNKSHEQKFTIFTRMLKNGPNGINLSKGSTIVFEPLAYSDSGSLKSGDLVFAGFGITLTKQDKLQYDDYKGMDVKNKIVIVMTGDPGIGNKKSPFRNPDYVNYRSLMYKMKNAQLHGAKGILFVHDPLSFGEKKEPELLFNETESGGHRFDILAGFVKGTWVNSLLGKEHNLKELQKKMAKETRPQSFLLNKKIQLDVHLKKETGRVSNIVGVISGKDPVKKDKWIVIGAHFDHLGLGGHSSMDPSLVNKVHHGADDNASGVSVVLSLAQKIQQNPLDHSVLVVLFNAEENGLLGSRSFVSRLETKNVIGMLNFDMVGRYQQHVSVMGVLSSKNFQSLIQKTEEKDRFDLKLKLQDFALGSSDHAAFLEKKIPSLFFSTGAHEDYHRPSDTWEKIDYHHMGEIRNFTLKFLLHLDQAKNIVFNPDFPAMPTSSGKRGYGSHLGCIPQFGGTNNVQGVLCKGTVPHSPAFKAGLQTGDVITDLGEIKIKNLYDLAFALRYFRPGDKVLLVWQRNKKAIQKQVVLAKSSKD